MRAWRTMLEVHSWLIDELAARLRANHGLGINEFDVLINLGPREHCRHGELARRVVLSRTALTRLVDRMCQRGLLSRQPDDGDGRGVRISLTEQGRQLRAAAGRTNTRVVEAGLAPLSPDELAQLQGLLDRLNRFGVRPPDAGGPDHRPSGPPTD